jgi:hypothetical protein
VSILALLVSTGFGICCVVNRLRDFRATTRAARMREDKEPDDKIQPYRDLYKKLGKWTWILFLWQIGAFGVGILCGVLGFLASISQKLL